MFYSFIRFDESVVLNKKVSIPRFTYNNIWTKYDSNFSKFDIDFSRKANLNDNYKKLINSTTPFK